MASTEKKESNHVGEFELIARLANFGTASDLQSSETVLTGIGDDAAVVSTPSDQMLLTTDAIVDGVHFRSVDERWFDIGWKCAVSNISDIAAMGGTPDNALVTLGVPPGASIETYEEFYAGMNDAFKSFGGRIVGGDVVSSATMFVNLALTGHPSVGPDGTTRSLTRDEAKLGDKVCVTGPLGSAAGGLEVLLSGLTNPSGQILVDRHFRPTPRVALGNALVACGVRCAMDISDGLIGDLEKIAKSSNVGITIDIPNIPLASELIFMVGTSAVDLALGGGEDYELAFTAPELIVNSLPSEVRNQISVIGAVTSDNQDAGSVRVLDKDGGNYEPVRKGWDHLNG